MFVGKQVTTATPKPRFVLGHASTSLLKDTNRTVLTVRARLYIFAEKFQSNGALYQGTASAGPQTLAEKDPGFSPCGH
jgi:hypothetical protein